VQTTTRDEMSAVAERANNYLIMEDVCRLLGRKVGTYAWLPGQTSADDYSTRIVRGPGHAYQWSCTQNGEKLTAADFTKGCQVSIIRARWQ
jgi:hypothetical protein